MKHFFLVLSLLIFANQARSEDNNLYKINTGDILEISVWNEDELQREVRVLPDGCISFPLAGTLMISGMTINDVRTELKGKLSEFIADPEINISIKAVEGNTVYIVGQVKNPGKFVMYQKMNIMQILSLAGGLTSFAKANDIVILRTSDQGSEAIQFKYGELEDGEELDKNHVLMSGDVIVVP